MDKKQQELQENYMKFQTLQNQRNKSIQQIKALEEQITELGLVRKGLDDIEDTKTDTEMLVPISSGIFLKAKLIEAEELVINVGSNVAVTKKMPDAKKLLDEQSDKMNKVYQQLITDITNMEMQINTLQKKVEELSR